MKISVAIADISSFRIFIQRNSLWCLSFCIIYFSEVLPVKGQFIPGIFTNIEGNRNYEFTLLRDEPYGIYISAAVLWTANGTPHILRIFLNDQQVYFHRDVNSSTGSGQQSGYLGSLIKGPLTAGTKIRLKGIVEAPADPTARLFALSAMPVNYDASVNLANLEQKINTLEATLQSRIDQNAGKINDIANQLKELKSDIDEFQRRFDNLNYNQFKTDISSRVGVLDKKISVLTNQLEKRIAGLTQQMESLKESSSQFQIDTISRFNAFQTQIAANKHKPPPYGRKTTSKRSFDTLGIIGVSLGGAAAMIATGGAYYQFLEKKEYIKKPPKLYHEK